ncbi:MAG: tetratricopeptide repeat protein [Bacteroidaceae bacterium]|nr:tetratricopeptide repeat protein [Bacteroidaceae bacterium]
MNTRNTLPLILALMMALLTGCTNRAAMKELTYLETRMEANADSVRTALAAMDGNRLRGEARALHALLYSQALDKCYIDVARDSIISVATKYYHNGNKPLRALQSLYYHGRVYENANEHKKAIELYTQAIAYVDNVTDYYIVGLLYAHLGHLYRKDYNYTLALEYLQKSFDYYELSGSERMKYVAIRNIGSTYLYMEDAKNAEIYLKMALEWGIEHKDKSLCSSAITHLMRLYDAMGESERFFDLYKSNAYAMYSDEMNVNSYLAYQYALIGDIKASEEHLQKAWQKAKNINDTIMLNYQEYRIQKQLGNYKHALAKHELLYGTQDSILRITLRQPLLASQRDFFQEQSELTELKLQKSRQAIFFICVVAILAIAIIIIVSRTRARKKREELDGYVNLTEDLQRSLYSKEETINRMGAQLQQHDEKERTMSTRLADLMRGRYELLNELTNTYYETSGSRNTGKSESKADREAIYQKVKKAIDRMAGNRKEMQELESIVNEYCDNAMAHIHAELPELPYDDTVLLCYIYAGFSAKAIHLFTKNSISNIYSRKSRLRDYIKQSDAPHRQQLLDMMP